jgi:hypothetical protein
MDCNDVPAGLTPAPRRATIAAVPEAANHEGEIEPLAPSGPRNLSVTGWARDRDSDTPIQVDITVNGAVVTTVTADRPRPGEASNGFAARIFAPTQPAVVCARTVAAPPLDGVVIGCRRLRFPVPVSLLPRTDLPPPSGQTATFFWIDSRGDVAKTVFEAPVVDGVAIYDHEPLVEPELRWAVSVHDPGERAFFRSGPLPKLPGPAGAITADALGIRVHRDPTQISFGLLGEGVPELFRRRIEQLPARNLEFDLDADSEERVHATVRGRRRTFPFGSFEYRLVVAVRPQSHPGRPSDVLAVEPAGPGVGLGSIQGLRAELDRAIVEGVKQGLEGAIRFIAGVQIEQHGGDFRPTHVSLTRFELQPLNPEALVGITVHGGTVTGGVGGVIVNG